MVPDNSSNSSDPFFDRLSLFCLLMAIFVSLVHNSTGASVLNDGSDSYVLVKWFHQDFFNRGIAICAVPSFFMISGLLFFRNYRSQNYFSKFKNRIKSLLVPFLVWNAIGIIIAILIGLPVIREFILSREVFVFKKENFLEGLFIYKYNGIFWYVLDLMIFVLLSPLIFKLLKHKFWGIFFLVMFLFLYEIGIKVPSDIFYRSDVLFYYMVGCYLGIHFFSIVVKPVSNIVIFWSVLIGFPVCYFSFYYGICGDSVYSFNVLGIMLCMIYGSIFWCILPNGTIPLIKNYAGLPFFIYASHIHICGVFTKFFPRISPFEAGITYFLTLLFSTILTVLICFLISKIMKRYAIGIWNMLSGGR